MDWDKLRVFKAVAEAGSFTHAGENMNLSQSAVSRQISGLEESLSLPLFHRHARGLVLTEQGEMLYHTTCEVFDKLQNVQTRLTDSRTLPEGTLTITTVEFIASTWLAPQLAEFKDLYPEIQVTLLLDDRVYDLGRREADIALRLQKAENSDLIQRHMMNIDFVLCTSRAYIDRHGAPRTLDDLRNHHMIGYPQNIHTPFLKPNWIFNRLNIDTHNNSNVTLLNSMNARYMAIKYGAGIAALPTYIAEHDDSLITIFTDELNIPSIDMFFVYPQERRNSKRISVFRDFLSRKIKEKFL